MSSKRGTIGILKKHLESKACLFKLPKLDDTS